MVSHDPTIIVALGCLSWAFLIASTVAGRKSLFHHNLCLTRQVLCHSSFSYLSVYCFLTIVFLLSFSQFILWLNFSSIYVSLSLFTEIKYWSWLPQNFRILTAMGETFLLWPTITYTTNSPLPYNWNSWLPYSFFWNSWLPYS